MGDKGIFEGSNNGVNYYRSFDGKNIYTEKDGAIRWFSTAPAWDALGKKIYLGITA